MLRTDLDPTAKLVGSAIAAHMNRYGWAKPSKQTLATLCSISVRAVDGAVDRLEEAGCITVQRSNGRHPNEYQGHLNPQVAALFKRRARKGPTPQLTTLQPRR